MVGVDDSKLRSSTLSTPNSMSFALLHKMAIAEAGDVVHGQLSTLSTQALPRQIAILRLALALILTKGLMQRCSGHKGTFTAKQRIRRGEDVAVTGQLGCLQKANSQMVHDDHQVKLSLGSKAAQENVGTRPVEAQDCATFSRRLKHWKGAHASGE